MNRRDTLKLSAFIILNLAVIKLAKLIIDNIEASQDELDIAKETMAIFLAGYGSNTEPTVEQVAARGKLAILSWRALIKNRVG